MNYLTIFQRTIWQFFNALLSVFFSEPFGYGFEALLISEKQVCRQRGI